MGKNTQYILQQLIALSLFVCLTQIAQSYAVTPQEAETLDLTNKERKKAGLKALKINNQLVNIARSQSASMARERQLSHVIKGKNLASRVKKSSYSYKLLGENIAQSRGSTSKVMKMWMSSSGHRMNILKHKFTEIGIGTAVAANGDIYYTHGFGLQKNTLTFLA